MELRRIRIVDAREQEVLAVLHWDGASVVIETPCEPIRAGHIRHDLQSVSSADSDRRVTPADGAAYLDGVLATYSGAFVYAVEDQL